MKTFKEEIIELLKDMAISALNALKMTFKDFSSFRNRLIGYVCLIGLIVLLSEKAQPGVQAAVVGILGVIISYYFKQRNDNDRIHKEGEEDENEKDN